jgi:hypothetical protein
MPQHDLTRRDVLRAGAAAAVTTPLLTSLAEAEVPSEAPTMRNVPFERRQNVRVGFIGTGGRGRGLLSDFLAIGTVQVKAICDIDPKALAAAQRMLAAKGQKAEEYGKDKRHYEKLNERDDLDLVVIATPWDWHVPMALHAMRSGHHCAVEVPAATTIKDCWALVNTSEKTRKHCVMLENCNYGYNELMALNMVKAGLLGDITHGEAAYIHDLRSLLYSDSGEGLWRRFPHIERNGNLYPTHGLGPVAFYMDIHRGDRFVAINSMSSKEAALSEWGRKNLKAGDPKLKEKYVCGDINTSILRTERGRTVMLQHDTVTPRPYTRHNMVCGTQGTFADYPARLALDSVGGGHEWVEDLAPYKAKYEHELWRANGELARKSGGHGGMDFIMCYRLIECMEKGLPPDMDVYDAAAWSAPGPLSEASVRRGGALEKFPDFTRGNWK